MKQCINCTQSLRAEAQFCDRCGARQPSIVPLTARRIPRQQSDRQALIVVTIIIGVLIVLGQVFNAMRSDTQTDQMAFSGGAERVVATGPRITARPVELTTTPTQIATTSVVPAVVPTPMVNGTVSTRTNIRDRPSINASTVIGKLNPGDVFTLLGRISDRSWYRVETAAGTEGWVRADLIQVDATRAENLPIDTNPVSLEVAQVATATEALPTTLPVTPRVPYPTPTPFHSFFDAQALQDANIRDKPTTSGSKILGQVDAGEWVMLRYRTTDGAWVSVYKDGGVFGWVSKSLLKINESGFEFISVSDTDGSVPGSEPIYTSPSGRTGAICRDGTRSSATGRGACSHHGGVASWR